MTNDFLMQLRPLSIDHGASDAKDPDTKLIEAIEKKGGAVKRTIQHINGQKTHAVNVPSNRVGELMQEFPDLFVERDTNLQLF